MGINFCFICFANVGSSNAGAGRKRGRKSKNELLLLDKRRKAGSVKLLLKYLTSTKTGRYDSVLKDILQLSEVGVDCGTSDGVKGQNLLQLCGKCEKVAGTVLMLHLELEKIQMRIVEEVKAVRGKILESSGWLGGSGSGGGEEELDNAFEHFSRRFCEGELEPDVKMIFNALKAFQTAVHEKGQDSILIPLVYLEKYAFIEKTPLPQSTANIEDMVKTEPDQDQIQGEELGLAPFSLGNIFEDNFLFVNSEDEVQLPLTDNPVKEESSEGIPKVGRLRPRRSCASLTLSRIADSSKNLDMWRTTEQDQDSNRKLPFRKRAKPKYYKGRPKQYNKQRKRPKEIHFHYECEICIDKNRFFSRGRFEQHMREHETEEKRFYCGPCHEGFSTEQLFRYHEGQHKGRHKLNCDICRHAFPRFDFPEHLKAHLGEEGPIFPCSSCSHVSSSMDKSFRHLQKHHVGVLDVKCEICGLPCKTKIGLVRHLIEVHGVGKLMECDVEGCTKSFMSDSALYNHKISHTDRFECSECKKGFGAASNLDTHIKQVHSGERERPFHCDQCPDSFLSKCSLQTHMIHKHGAPKLQCGFRDREFSSTKRLGFHRTEEHDESAKICPICNKKCATEARFRYHMGTHAEDKSFMCEICGKAFKSAHRIRVHKLIHRGEFVKCPQCPKTFSMHKYLTTHMRVHTGEKPCICVYCGKGFTQKNSQNAHQRICPQRQRPSTSASLAVVPSAASDGDSSSLPLNLQQGDFTGCND